MGRRKEPKLYSLPRSFVVLPGDGRVTVTFYDDERREVEISMPVARARALCAAMNEAADRSEPVVVTNNAANGRH